MKYDLLDIGVVDRIARVDWVMYLVDVVMEEEGRNKDEEEDP